jgi:hypothetical protein
MRRLGVAGSEHDDSTLMSTGRQVEIVLKIARTQLNADGKSVDTADQVGNLRYRNLRW